MSSKSQPFFAIGIAQIDKLIHFLEYMPLGLLLGRALNNEYPEKNLKTLKLTAFIIAVCYAASDEFHQRFITGRTSSLLDWIADTFGAAIGSFCFISRTKNKKKEWPE